MELYTSGAVGVQSCRLVFTFDFGLFHSELKKNADCKRLGDLARSLVSIVIGFNTFQLITIVHH